MCDDSAKRENYNPRWIPALVGTDRNRYPSAPYSPYVTDTHVSQRSPRSGILRTRPRTRSEDLPPLPQHQDLANNSAAFVNLGSHGGIANTPHHTEIVGKPASR
jgi:hypothetical protein